MIDTCDYFIYYKKMKN